jgi:hypothetical protein
MEWSQELGEEMWRRTSNAEKEDCAVLGADCREGCCEEGAGEGLGGRLREPWLGDGERIG